MKKIEVFSATLVLISIFGIQDESSGSTITGEQLRNMFPDGTKIVAAENKKINGDEYVFIKTIDKETKDAIGVVFDSEGNVVEDESLLNVRPQKISTELQKMLDSPSSSINKKASAKVKVNIALKIDQAEPEVDSPPVQGAASFVKGKVVASQVDRVAASEDKVEKINRQKQEANKRAATARHESRKRVLAELSSINKWISRAEVKDAVAKEKDTLTISLTKEEIEYLLKYGDDLIDGIELYVEPKDDISSAMIKTRINPYAIGYSGRKGENIGIYMTESGCPPSGFITNYRLLAGSNTDHSRNVSSIMRAVAPQSYIYCRGGATLPTSTDINGYDGKPRVHLVNRSNGGGDNGAFTTLDRDWDNFIYNNSIPVFNSAGNNGLLNGYVSSPANGLNVVSVGSYNETNATISSFSSYKNPQTKNEKPEISAPGENITAGGYTKSGTSMAAPHAAAFAADLLSSYSSYRLRPYLVKAQMLSGADDVITGGTDKVGAGGIDFYRAYYNMSWVWWEGGNSSYATFDSQDAWPNNGYIDAKVYLSSTYSNVRAALTWLNSGTYTYNNRTAAYPMGMDIDLAIYDPNGAYVGGSASIFNPYELVSFKPAVSGYYRFRIHRYANRDTGSKLHMGLVVDWL